MNWNTFVEDYNELTALSFDHLYYFGKEDEDLEILFPALIELAYYKLKERMFN